MLMFEKFTIMHDIDPSYLGKDENSLKLEQIFIDNILKSSMMKRIPDWVNNIKILDEKKIEQQLENLDIEIKKLEYKKSEDLTELEKNREYKKLLFETGDELVEIVKKVLMEMLGIPVQDLDIKKEDLSFKLGEKKILVEVKGVNTPVKREHVSQIQRHIEDDASASNIEDDEIYEKYKGLLIINPYVKVSIQEREMKEIYNKTVIGDIEHYNICAIDTITLLALFQKYKSGMKIDLGEIILDSNIVKPDFSFLEL